MTTRARADRALLDLRKVQLEAQKMTWITPAQARSIDGHVAALEMLLRAVPDPTKEVSTSEASLDDLFD